MKNEDEALNLLFAEAREAQEKMAAAVEIGVESRLKSRLRADSARSSELWVHVLVRLCSAGAIMTGILGVLSLESNTDASTLLMVERIVLGI